MFIFFLWFLWAVAYLYNGVRNVSKHRDALTDSFCYICAYFKTVAQYRTINTLLRTIFTVNLEIRINPGFLLQWTNCNGLMAKSSLQLCCPVIWRASQSYIDDCYFCLLNITGYNDSLKKWNIPTFLQLWNLFPTQTIILFLVPEYIRIFFPQQSGNALRWGSCQVGLCWWQCLCLFRSKWQCAPLYPSEKPEWSWPWFIPI